MRGVLNIPASGVLRWFGDCLANRYLHLVWIGLRQYPIEIQIEERLVDAVEILQISKGDQFAVTKAMSLVGCQLCRCAARSEGYPRAYRERQPSATEHIFPGFHYRLL